MADAVVAPVRQAVQWLKTYQLREADRARHYLGKNIASRYESVHRGEIHIC